MKWFTFTFGIIFALSLPFLAQASKTTDVAFLIRQPNHLKAAFLTLKEMKNGHFSIDYGKAVIVVCGKGVNSLKKGGDFEKELLKSASVQIKVKACGLTLKKLGVKPSSLHPAVQVVENGLYEMIRLKSEGFLSVDI